MKKTILTFTLSMVCLAAYPAAVQGYYYNTYLIHGNGCFSITSGEEAHYSLWGAGAIGTALDVTCPIVLPDQNYSNAEISVNGYNRSSTDGISCRISGTNYDGGNEASGTATLSVNQQPLQVASASVSLSNNRWLSLKCHLPAYTALGYSHLHSIQLKMKVGY
ncbi:MAG TPA: hypothetical protein VJ385_10490 [Fibrobacteria bacterium]|nr:hypothetical protein [Fibrobacteria bacterium]